VTRGSGAIDPGLRAATVDRQVGPDALSADSRGRNLPAVVSFFLFPAVSLGRKESAQHQGT
jgi:hypothetical protein